MTGWSGGPRLPSAVSYRLSAGRTCPCRRSAPPSSASSPAGIGRCGPRSRSARSSSRACQARGASAPRRAANASSRSAVPAGGTSRTAAASTPTVSGAVSAPSNASAHSRFISTTRSFWTAARLRVSPGSRRKSYSSSVVPRMSLKPAARTAKAGSPPSQFEAATASDRAGRGGRVPSGSSSAVRLIPSIGRGAESFSRSSSVGARSNRRTGSGMERSRTASPGTRSRIGTRRVAS
jgi:hypothetical protein